MTGTEFVFGLREDIYPLGFSVYIGELDAPNTIQAGAGYFIFREEWYE